jgi:hypothetical protein
MKWGVHVDSPIKPTVPDVNIQRQGMDITAEAVLDARVTLVDRQESRICPLFFP